MGRKRRYIRAGVWAGPTPAKSKGKKSRRSSRCLAGPALTRSTTPRTPQPHWITEMMVTRKEPFNAERLLLSTGIVIVQHGIKLGERPLLCRRTPHRDAVHEHDLPLDTGTAI